MSDKLFLYNYITKNKVPLYYARFNTLKESLENYANDLLYPANLKFTKAKNICLQSNLIIKSYKTRNHELIKNKPTAPKLKAAQIYSQLIYNDYDFNLMFRDFVFEKITIRNKDKKIYYKNSLIIIEHENEKLGIMTNFKKVNMQNLCDFQCDISKALDMKKMQNLQNLYIVCPRNMDFRKHIEIKSQNNDYMGVKIVPYTLSNLNTKGRK